LLLSEGLFFYRLEIFKLLEIRELRRFLIVITID